MRKQMIYENLMKNLSRDLRKTLDEKFEAPEKTFAEKLPGGQKRYEQRVKDAQNEYYAKMQKQFTKDLTNAKSFMDLLRISREMAEYGYTFPIAGMVRNGEPINAEPSDIYWMTYDRDLYLNT